MRSAPTTASRPDHEIDAVRWLPVDRRAGPVELRPRPRVLDGVRRAAAAPRRRGAGAARLGRRARRLDRRRTTSARWTTAGTAATPSALAALLALLRARAAGRRATPVRCRQTWRRWPPRSACRSRWTPPSTRTADPTRRPRGPAGARRRGRRDRGVQPGQADAAAAGAICAGGGAERYRTAKGTGWVLVVRRRRLARSPLRRSST